MKHLLTLALLIIASGCAKPPSVEPSGDIDLFYQHWVGSGSTKDSLHVTTVYDPSKEVSWRPGQVTSWVFRVPPIIKPFFMTQLSAALRRNRVDLIGHETSKTSDLSSWNLRIRGAGLDIDAVILYRVGDTPDDYPWRDSRLKTMRGFVSDLRLMAELYAVKQPEELVDSEGSPNNLPEATPGKRPPEAPSPSSGASLL